MGLTNLLCSITKNLCLIADTEKSMVNKPLSSILLTCGVLLTTITVSIPNALAQRVFRIRNTTGQDIIDLYVSSSSSQVWGLDNLEPNQVLSNGDVINIKLEDDCLYDVKARLVDGEQIETHQVNTCSTSWLTLETNGNVVQATEITTAEPIRSRGFWCDTSTGIPETRYQGTSQSPEVWIRWGSDFFSSSGYDPLTRCRAVSGRLESYRRSGKLNYMGVGRMNGQNIICTAIQPGDCVGLIYTLKPQQEPVETLQQFIQHRKGIVGVAPLYESEDGEEFTPFIDVRPFLNSSNDNSNIPTSSPNQVSPIIQQSGEQLRPLN